MAQHNNGTVTACRADTSVSPTAYSATVSYPNPPPAPPPDPKVIDHTGLDKDHYDNFLKALGAALKVDTTTNATGDVTGTTVHT